MEAVPRPRPPHLHFERSRHGQMRWYVRIGKGPRIRIRAQYSTPEFEAAYQAALRGEIAPAGEEFASQTFGWLVARYHDSAAWAKLSAATRRQRENIIKHVLKTAGREPIGRIDKRSIMGGLDRRKNTAGAARHFLQTMRGIFEWAVESQLAAANPTAGIVPTRKPSEGFHTWTEEERERFKRRWPLRTKERVWYAVLYCTGLRRGDVVRVGRQHIRKNGMGAIPTEKTGEIGYFVADAELEAALAAGPTGDLTFIVGDKGNALTKESFGNLFRNACKLAGVPGSAHGLRKARATYYADNGATEAELDSLFGWKRGSGMSRVYTAKADRERLAQSAAEKLEERSINVYARTRPSGAGAKAKKPNASNR